MKLTDTQNQKERIKSDIKSLKRTSIFHGTAAVLSAVVTMLIPEQSTFTLPVLDLQVQDKFAAFFFALAFFYNVYSRQAKIRTKERLLSQFGD